MAWIPAHAVESLALYDNFNNPLIDPNKWFGAEAGLGAEARRIIQGGALRVFFVAYGNTASNSSLTNSALQLRFINPAAVTAIKATINVRQSAFTNCPLNPEPTRVRARLSGAFFNSGTPTPGDLTNDVIAEVAVQRRGDSTDPPGVMRVRAFVNRCNDAVCTADLLTLLFFQDLGSVATGVPATISVQWDQPNHRFIFGFGGSKVGAPYAVPDTAPPVLQRKDLNVQHRVPNCTAVPRPRGSMDASFDDVFVNASAASLRGSGAPPNIQFEHAYGR